MELLVFEVLDALLVKELVVIFVLSRVMWNQGYLNDRKEQRQSENHHINLDTDLEDGNSIID